MDVIEVNMQLQFNIDKTAAYKDNDEALQITITREIKQKFHSRIKREGQLTTISIIKAEAIKIELIL
jgi:hypothetical protein